MASRTVLITGTMTANASTLFSNITDYEPITKQAFLDNGWNIISLKLVGSWTSYTVQLSIEANVLNNFSLEQVRQSAISVLSNIYYKDSLIFDSRFPIFTNVYVNAAEANRRQIDDAFKANNSIQEIVSGASNAASDATKKALDSYIPQLVLIGVIIFLLRD